MIQSSVTISLVPEARGGPFIFWDNLEESCARAAALGFAAVEIFLPSANHVERSALTSLLEKHHLKLAALGTGAGWMRHRLHLSHSDPAIRAGARDFVAGMIDLAASFQAPAIIGSMQGRFENGVSHDQAMQWLAEGLTTLAERAARNHQPLLYEPLNRYETNLINRISDAVALVDSLPGRNVRILADLFHMNIEEESIPAALRQAGARIGHIHFVDSNRRPAGFGHLDFGAVARALREIGYSGFASAEALPYPNSEEAARQTMTAFNKYLGKE